MHLHRSLAVVSRVPWRRHVHVQQRTVEVATLVMVRGSTTPSPGSSGTSNDSPSERLGFRGPDTASASCRHVARSTASQRGS